MDLVSMYFSGKVLDKSSIKRSEITEVNSFFPLLQLKIRGEKISEITVIRYYSDPNAKNASMYHFCILGAYPIQKGDSLFLKGEGFYVNGVPVIYSY